MTNYEVLGFRKSERQRKKGSGSYVACNLYLAYEDSSVNGLRCINVFTMADRVPADIKVGDRVYLFYNRFGNVEEVKRVDMELRYG